MIVTELELSMDKLFIRTCQSCGFEQEDQDPQNKLSDAYRNRKCKKCKSESLDYGSYKSNLPDLSGNVGSEES